MGNLGTVFHLKLIGLRSLTVIGCFFGSNLGYHLGCVGTNVSPLGLRYWSSGTIGGPFMLFLFSDHNVGLSLILVLNLFLILFLILVSYDAYRMWYVVRSMTHTGCGMSCGPWRIQDVVCRAVQRPFMSCSIYNDHLCRATIYVVICALKIH